MKIRGRFLGVHVCEERLHHLRFDDAHTGLFIDPGRDKRDEFVKIFAGNHRAGISLFRRGIVQSGEIPSALIDLARNLEHFHIVILDAAADNRQATRSGKIEYGDLMDPWRSKQIERIHRLFPDFRRHLVTLS